MRFPREPKLSRSTAAPKENKPKESFPLPCSMAVFTANIAVNLSVDFSWCFEGESQPLAVKASLTRGQNQLYEPVCRVDSDELDTPTNM